MAVDQDADFVPLETSQHHIIRDDAELVESFASAAAVSIEKALLHRQVLEKQRIEDQLKVAREVQSGLLPPAPPELPGWDVAGDPRYVAGRAATRSELAVLIVSEAGTIGCLNVESNRPSFFTPADAELLQFFASAAALSIDNALLHRQVLDSQRLEDQLRVADEVQSGLLPDAPPDLPGYDIAAVNLPSHAIGGDYYDYVPLRGDRLGLAVADVSGKGIPAALIMATFRAALRTQMRRRSRLTAVASQLNGAVLEFRDASRYVTAVCAVLEADGRVRYVNCGHNPPLVLRAGGSREMLRRGGAALGLFAGERFREVQTHNATF